MSTTALTSADWLTRYLGERCQAAYATGYRHPSNFSAAFEFLRLFPQVGQAR